MNSDPLITYLATHDAPCPGCKYNLKGISSKTCPECGQEVDLKRILQRDRRKKSGVEIHIQGPEQFDSAWYKRAALTLAICFVIGLLLVVVLAVAFTVIGPSSASSIPLLP